MLLAEDRIAFVLGEGASAVGAIGDALDLNLVRAAQTSRPGEGGDDRRCVARLEAGRIVPIDGGGAGVHRAGCVGEQTDRLLLPMHQIRADVVCPVLAAQAVGVLVEQVVLSVVIDQSVRIVQSSEPTVNVEGGLAVAGLVLGDVG